MVQIMTILGIKGISPSIKSIKIFRRFAFTEFAKVLRRYCLHSLVYFRRQKCRSQCEKGYRVAKVRKDNILPA